MISEAAKKELNAQINYNGCSQHTFSWALICVGCCGSCEFLSSFEFAEWPSALVLLELNLIRLHVPKDVCISVMRFNDFRDVGTRLLSRDEKMRMFFSFGVHFGASAFLHLAIEWFGVFRNTESTHTNTHAIFGCYALVCDVGCAFGWIDDEYVMFMIFVLEIPLSWYWSWHRHISDKNQKRKCVNDERTPTPNGEGGRGDNDDDDKCQRDCR